MAQSGNTLPLRYVKPPLGQPIKKILTQPSRPPYQVHSKASKRSDRSRDASNQQIHRPFSRFRSSLGLQEGRNGVLLRWHCGAKSREAEGARSAVWEASQPSGRLVDADGKYVWERV